MSANKLSGVWFFSGGIKNYGSDIGINRQVDQSKTNMEM